MAISKPKLGLITIAVIIIASVSFFTLTYGSPKTSASIPKISINASYVKFETVSELDSSAELIIVGTPTQDFDERKHVVTTFDDGTLQDFYTITDVKVDQVIKAPKDSSLANGDSLSIIEPISYIEDGAGKKKISFEDYTELKQSEKNIIFLKKNTQGQYSIINMDLGKFSLNSSAKSFSASSEEQIVKDGFRKQVLEKYKVN
ncbi:hypothetical protein [Paenibacillus sp. URB8-2]|uniref:hypothetical protein n=1 Tax=Paenibacillus sp. URB8-2 TaxID=2741301 RepID=UPI0015BE6088|nr:hypothetical protein [Paenibacillus sp. URB8-2]BCG57094.1 hypothetical protein PUR_05190 [Paenibacillus sp. URB8-2]